MPPAPGELSDTDVIVASTTKKEAGGCGNNHGATMPPQDAMTASDSPGQSRKAGAVTIPSTTADSVDNAESITGQSGPHLSLASVPVPTASALVWPHT